MTMPASATPLIAKLSRMGSRAAEAMMTKKNYGADDGARTRDIQDHNLALYQLSYDRRGYVCLHDSRPARKTV